VNVTSTFSHVASIIFPATSTKVFHTPSCRTSTNCDGQRVSPVLATATARPSRS
jgi:hypothetical protein